MYVWNLDTRTVQAQSDGAWAILEIEHDQKQHSVRRLWHWTSDLKI